MGAIKVGKFESRDSSHYYAAAHEIGVMVGGEPLISWHNRRMIQVVVAIFGLALKQAWWL